MDVPHELTDPPRPDGTTQAECMKLALKEAGFDESKDNLYINAHGTGTHLNDLTETVAYKIALESDITLGISDSLGFGGHNACVAFRPFKD